MSKATSRLDIAIEEQARAWDAWNAKGRESRVGEISRRQAELVERWVQSLDWHHMRILDAGCGAGWLSERLAKYGDVTGVDFAADVIARAQARAPHIRFVAGDLMTVHVEGPYAVVVCLEVLSHVADQPAFIRRLASLMPPGGQLMLATQNRPVLERWSEVGGPMPGTIRQWVDAKGLRALLAPHFDVLELTSLCPVGNQGLHRIINAGKVDRLLGALVGAQRLLAWKERALLGHTLIVRAALRT